MNICFQIVEDLLAPVRKKIRAMIQLKKNDGQSKHCPS